MYWHRWRTLQLFVITVRPIFDDSSDLEIIAGRHAVIEQQDTQQVAVARATVLFPMICI